MTFVRGICLFVLLAGCGVFLSGCGAKPGYPSARLEGEITIAGQPLPDDAHADILFMPAGRRGQGPPVSVPILHSRYVAEAVPLGRVTVLFRASRPTGQMLDDYSGGLPEYENLVPDEYLGGLSLEVSEDNPNQDFHL